MFDKLESEVIVVGGGPVGLFSALLLVENGIDVQVIEEQWRTASRSYALALHPESLRLLGEMGLADRLIGRGKRIETISVYDEGKPCAELSISKLPVPYPFVLVLPQQALEDLLREKLEQKRTRIRWNHRVAGVEMKGDSVQLSVEKLSKESTGYSVARTEWVVDKMLQLNSRFVIGADGSRSLVRRSLGIEFEEVAPARIFAVFECKTREKTGRKSELVFGEDVVSVLWPMREGRYRWSFELKEADRELDPRVKSRLFVQFRDEQFPHVAEEKLAEFVTQRAPWFDLGLEEVLWSAEIRFETRLAASFGRDFVWLVGDAAHLASPVGIQSMNVGLREAASLSTCLKSVLRGESGLVVLEEHGRQWRSEWQGLMSPAPVEQPGQTEAWALKHADRLPSSLPASGSDLALLLDQVGL